MDPITTATIAGKVVDTVGDLISRWFPDKAEAEKRRSEADAALRAGVQAELDSFRRFIVEYEGEGDKVHPALQILRGSVRPVLTYALAGAFLYGFLHPAEFTTEHMQTLWQLNLLSMGFWYGERALSNLGLNINDLVKRRSGQ